MVSVAIVAASIALCVVAIVLLVALAYLIRILAIVLTGARRLDSSLRSFSGDVRSVIATIMQFVPRLGGDSSRKERKKKSQ